MCNFKLSKAMTCALMLTVAGASAHASETAKKGPVPKETKIGMASGVAVGALIGGPFGAGVGFIIGGAIGDHAKRVRDTDKKAQRLEGELAGVQEQLASAQLALAKASEKAGDDPMLAQLAERLRADVLFRTKSAELDPDAQSKLTDLAGVIAKYPGLVIEIDGYADPRGKADENMELSQQRASAVRSALIVGGANPDSIRIAAHGESLSTAAKGDMDAYAWERRVSLSVTHKGEGQVAQTK